MTRLRNSAAVALLAAASVLSAPALADVLLDFVSADQTVGPGRTFSLDLRISGLNEFSAPSLRSYTLNVVFDPVYLAFDGLSFGDPASGIDQLALFTPALTTSSPAGASTPIFLEEISNDSDDILNSDQLAEFVLARLNFHAIAAGSSSVGVTYGPQDLQFTDDAGGISDRVATVTAVPEPAPMLSLIAGLAAMLLVVRRRIQAPR